MSKPKPIRVILKDADSYETYYRMSFGNGQLVGRSGNEWLQYHLLIKPETILDYHFTYPADGNYHFSFKVNPGNKQATQRFISIYRDKIRDKYIASTGDTYINTYPRDYEKDRIINLLRNQISTYPSPPIKDIVRYNFPAFNIRLNEDFQTGLRNKKPLAQLKQTENDIVVDLQTCELNFISIASHVIRKGQPDSLDSFDNVTKKTIEIADRLHLIVYCWILEERNLFL